MAITDEEIEAATARGEALIATRPRAVSARYDAVRDLVEIAFGNGAFFSFPPSLTQALAEAAPQQLADIEVVGAGMGLYFPGCDADLYIPALVDGVFGSKAWMASRLGQEGGRVRSERKAAAARANGKLGGRPRKAS
ncbi:DUF2442 domain-containing protein [uncultured Caulobacter sp.]|jgi:Protein of unknown function (DUF2442)|uniref:DUF2442 domain-containing protein n=1 Tax=uncultured Caulobacter sp. TaxID=158749 RepID=UPI00260C8F48|nr:DUF2442 domain-containing protein [uncultured Caulobacter sp.]